MNNSRLKQKMSEEIQKRMGSESWNNRIAASVLGKINSKKKRFIYTASSFLAAAALILIFLMFGIKQESGSGVYDKFITEQVEETNTLALKKVGDSSRGQEANEPPFQSDIDTMIDETLAMR